MKHGYKNNSVTIQGRRITVIICLKYSFYNRLVNAALGASCVKFNFQSRPDANYQHI